MSRDSRKREALLADLNDGFRQLSAATILFHQGTEDRLGMNITESPGRGRIGQASQEATVAKQWRGIQQR
jgi:hypothetical protein